MTSRTGVQVRSGASIVAILAALASFFLAGSGMEGWALLAAFVAIVAGVVGSIKALSPHVSGGLLSILAVVLGGIAVLVALIAFFV